MSSEIPRAASPTKPADVVRPFTAAEIRGLHSIPLYSVNNFAVGNGFVEVSGLALPPDGEHASVSFVGDPGAVFQVEYPMLREEAAKYYWYWPNSNLSGFRLRIDLAATRTDVDYYTFRVAFAGFEDLPHESLRTMIILPKNLSHLENYPSQENLKRVQAFNTVNSVAATGMSDGARIVALARHYGWDGAGDVLDWGVGHGRVARHLNVFAKEARVWGVDIDPNNIAWAQSHLPSIKTSVGPLMPPTEYADGQFSLIYGISVMTHLERPVQKAWLEEIRRILKPGGLALLTFAGDASVAFSSRWIDRAYYETYMETGRGPSLPSGDLVGVIEKADYYKNVKQTIRKSRGLCGKFLEVLDALECIFGFQDLLVLRK